MIADVTQRIAQLEGLLTTTPATTTAGGATAPASTTTSFQDALTAATTAGATTGVAPENSATEPEAEELSGDTPVGVAATTTATGGATAPYQAQIDQAASDQGIDPSLLTALVQQESGFDPTAQSSAGASGLTQLMPTTAASLGVTDPLDPQQSLEGGAAYLRQQLDAFGGNTALALAAYNAGPGAVQAAGGVPDYPETQNYVSSILANAGTGGTT